MGNVIESFFSGFARSVGELFGSPLDFLSGKSCSSICEATWDFICYIENFCVINLLKMASVVALVYIVLLFLYLLYKLGICECVGGGLCKFVWAFFACWFSAVESCCAFFCFKLLQCKRTKPRHGRRHSEEFDMCVDWSSSYQLVHSQSHRKRTHLRKSLRPRSHRVVVGVKRQNSRNHETMAPRKHTHDGLVDDIRVVRTTKFSRKSASFRPGNHRNHRR